MKVYSNIKCLSNIKFFNSHIKDLYIFENSTNEIKLTPKTNYSKVFPENIDSPFLIRLNKELCEYLGFDYPSLLSYDTENNTLLTTTQILSGNKLIESCVPIAHCYCGYQFGNFAGQLGDGRAITFGDFYNNKSELWEFQLKGSGKTPYSRFADGKAVLRSSIREYIASEHLYNLGIPTTRALSIVDSNTFALRDPEYNGKAIYERCSVVSRLAPSFIRFGSFEIFKERDDLTNSEGPSAGNDLKMEMLPKMLDYLFKYHFKDIELKEEDNNNKLFEIITKRTAIMAASWHAYGFCHGVINTDNMSILGITIDYGPYGNIEFYDRFYIPNSSDKGGRYSFFQQKDICKWNLNKLTEAFDPIINIKDTSSIIREHYNKAYDLYLTSLVTNKLGFALNTVEINVLINDMFSLLEDFGLDLTIFYRNLNFLLLGDKNKFIDLLLKYSLDYESKVSKIKPSLPKDKLEQINMLFEVNPYYLLSLGIDETYIRYQTEKSKYYEYFINQYDSKVAYNEGRILKIRQWVDMFIKNHLMEIENLTCSNSKEQFLKILDINKLNDQYLFEYPLPEGVFKNLLLKQHEKLSDLVHKIHTEAECLKTKEVEQMILDYKLSLINELNPKFIMRRNLLQSVIKKAEEKDYSLFEKITSILSSPFDEFEDVKFDDGLFDANVDNTKEIVLSCSS